MDAHSKWLVSRWTTWLPVAGVCALGFACGSLAVGRSTPPLPGAGTPRDDGSGLLAAASIGPGSWEHGRFGDPSGAAYGQGYATAATGYAQTGGYTAAPESGATYANYTFQQTYEQASPAPSPYVGTYSTGPVEAGGWLEGDVTWPRAPDAAKTIPLAEGSGCGEIANPTLSIVGGKVAGALVYLEDIRKGRAHAEQGQPKRLQTGGLVMRQGCSFSPHVQIVAPIGATLTVTTNDPGRQSIGVEAWDAAGERSAGVGRTPIELLGLGASRDIRLDVAMLHSVSSDDQDARTGSWVVVAAHPYYTLTDTDGKFRLDDVPPGTYSLVVWHPTVYLGDGRWTEAKLVRRKVTVKSYAATKAAVVIK